MNLHHRYTRSISNTREMERTVLALFESYQRLDTDILGESLTSGRMSDFLFEADETEVETKVKEARDAAIKKLDEFEQVAVTLNNSKAINEFVKQMRARLAKVTLDSGGFRSLKDFAGITVKQMSFVGDGISQAIKSVDSAVDATVASLETLKIDYKSEVDKGSSIGVVIERHLAKNNVPGMSRDKFKQGIQQKMAKRTGKGGAGFFSQIMSMLKGSTTEPIVMSSEQFAKDLLACTGEQIEAYLKGPGPSAAESSAAPAADQVQAIVQTAGVDQKSIDNALPAGSKPTKITPSEWTELLRKPDDLKNAINDRAKKLGAKDGIIEQRGSAGRTAPVLVERWERLAGIRGDAR